MILSSDYSDDFHLNVLSFHSTVFNSFMSAQTKNYLVHFPVKTNQPGIKFSVQFANETDYETFQRFVEKHHWAALSNSYKNPEVKLWWPERGIENYTGYIDEFQMGGERFNVAPKAEFTVSLVDSMVTQKTDTSSLGTPFSSIFGPQINDLRNVLPNLIDQLTPSLVDQLLRPPDSNPQDLVAPSSSDGFLSANTRHYF